MSVVTLVSALGVARGVHAFDFNEHRMVGEGGYAHACYLLRAAYKASEAAPATPCVNDKCVDSKALDKGRLDKARLDLACPQGQYGSELSRAFGQAVAVSADYVAAPEDLGSIDGLRNALSVTYYATLALHNSTHFHPVVHERWRSYHADAMRVAAQASSPRDTAARFEEVFRLLAFGGHFLQDSFAAGHMGFNRPASAPVASLGFHDLYGQIGRVVATRGDIAHRDAWVTYGDGHLCYANDEHGEFV